MQLANAIWSIVRMRFYTVRCPEAGISSSVRYKPIGALNSFLDSFSRSGFAEARQISD